MGTLVPQCSGSVSHAPLVPTGEASVAVPVDVASDSSTSTGCADGSPALSTK